MKAKEEGRLCLGVIRANQQESRMVLLEEGERADSEASGDEDEGKEE